MSNLVVSNISDGTTSVATTHLTNGTGKAWCNWNGQGTVVIRNSHNVSSITDNGTGDYSVNFTSSFTAYDYTSTAISGRDVSTSQVGCFASVTGGTASAARITELAGTTFFDSLLFMTAIHGDLA
jgi:hypothetical protein